MVLSPVQDTNNAGNPHFCSMPIFHTLSLKKFILLITIVVLTIHARFLLGSPIIDEKVDEKNHPSADDFLPGETFSLVTNEKLAKLKDLADAVHDPKFQDLYRAVDHYVKMARKNNEYVLWKYDSHQEGLVLVLKQNLNGILYYGWTSQSTDWTSLLHEICFIPLFNIKG